MAKSASEVRANIYKLLDEVVETGVPLEIERKGKILRVMPPEDSSRLAKLARRDDFMKCAASDFVHMDWSEEWKP